MEISREISAPTKWRIVRMLLYDFSTLVLIALAVVTPFMYFAIDHWLAGFSSRIDASLWLILMPGALVLPVALLTVSYHTLRVALSNPIQSLQYE